MTSTQVLYEIKKMRPGKRRLNLSDIEHIAIEIGVKKYHVQVNNRWAYTWTKREYNKLIKKLKQENEL